MRAPAVVDIRLQVAVEAHLEWVSEDERIEAGAHNVDQHASALRDVDAGVAVLNDNIGSGVTEEADCGAEATAFQEARGGCLLV